MLAVRRARALRAPAPPSLSPRPARPGLATSPSRSARPLGSGDAASCASGEGPTGEGHQRRPASAPSRKARLRACACQALSLHASGRERLPAALDVPFVWHLGMSVASRAPRRASRTRCFLSCRSGECRQGCRMRESATGKGHAPPKAPLRPEPTSRPPHTASPRSLPSTACSNLALPCPAKPGLGLPCLAWPCRASPCHVMPLLPSCPIAKSTV